MTLIIHHDNCPDGFGSAFWLAHCLHLNGEPDQIQILGAAYGDEPPLFDAHERDVFVVDYCYPAEQLDALANEASTVTVLDHHETAHKYVENSVYEKYDSVVDLPFPDKRPRLAAVIDESRSGIGNVVAWCDDHLPWTQGYVEPPQFLWNLQDRDLWRFDLEGTAEVFAAVTSRQYAIEDWRELLQMPWEAIVAEGRAIARYRERLIEQVVDTAHIVVLGGIEMPLAACPYAVGSDVAGRLAEMHPNSVAAYYIPYGATIRFGLRSRGDGPNVAELAERFGGGGHAQASGFEVATEDINGVIG